MNTVSKVIELKNIHPQTETACLSESVRTSLVQYLKDLDGNHPGNLYDMVLRQVEEPLLQIVMDYVDGNQSKAAECLGINRGTLRKKLQTYNLLK